EVSLPSPVECGIPDLFEQGVRLTIDDAIALLNHRTADRLGEMTFPRPWWPEKERVLPLGNETAGSELVDERTIHLLVEVEIKGIEGPIDITKTRLFV